MFKGRYKRRTESFDSLRSPLFQAGTSELAYGGGCGAYALAMLTHAPTCEFRVQNKRRSHYSDRFMVKTLRERGYTVRPLKWKELNSDAYIGSPIDERHVILYSQIMCKREASWMILHDNRSYHNFDVRTPMLHSFFAKPVLTAYVVFHPSWREQPVKKKQKDLKKGLEYRIVFA